MRDTLFFPSAPRVLGPDVAYAALPLLHRARSALEAAARLAAVDRRRRRWGVPDVFFFDSELQSEWEAVRPDRPAEPDWPVLADLLADVLTLLPGSAEARRAARVVPGLARAAAAVAPVCRRARELAELLAVPDDEVVRVVCPSEGTGFRVFVRGVADVAQFHVLLADAVCGSPDRGKLPVPRPDPAVVTAYRDGDPEPDLEYVPRFQLHRPAGLRPDGTVATGFCGSDHWLWGPEPLGSVPRVGDERTVLVGPRVVGTGWEVGRRFPRMPGELRLLEVLPGEAVADWIEGQTGRRPRYDVEATQRAA